MLAFPVSIDVALNDCALFGAALPERDSWARWAAVLRAAFGSPLDDQQRVQFAAVAGGRDPPTERVAELWVLAGRRSGKSRMAAATAAFVGAFCRPDLSAGESASVALLAPTRKQAAIGLGYIRGFLSASPVLRGMVRSETAEELVLANGVTISVLAGSHRSIRGRSMLAVICDEASFMRGDDATESVEEIHRACAPALAASGGLWIGVSTAFRRRGIIFERFRDFFGKSDPRILVLKGETRQFNANIPQAIIDQAYADDPESARAEWGAEFRSDSSAFLDDALVDAAIDVQRPLELPPRHSVLYRCFIDASGGRHDRFAMSVAHSEQERVIVDVARAIAPPFNPASVVEEFATVIRDYGCRAVTGDRYGAEWTASAFKEHDITLEHSDKTKSELFIESLPLFTRGTISIPDHSLLTRELRQLERRASRTGRDLVDGFTASDDLANAVCGAAVLAMKPAAAVFHGVIGIDGKISVVDSMPQRRWVRRTVDELSFDTVLKLKA